MLPTTCKLHLVFTVIGVLEAQNVLPYLQGENETVKTTVKLVKSLLISSAFFCNPFTKLTLKSLSLALCKIQTKFMTGGTKSLN